MAGLYDGMETCKTNFRKNDKITILLNRIEMTWFSQHLFCISPLLCKYNRMFLIQGMPGLSFTFYYGITVIALFVYNEYSNRLKNDILEAGNCELCTAKKLASFIIGITRMFAILCCGLRYGLQRKMN